MQTTKSYQEQARGFLDRNGLKFHAVRCVPQQQPDWQEINDKLIHGHWWITIDRESNGMRLGFPFWTSHNDELAYQGKNLPRDDKAQRATIKARRGPDAYDVLSSISGDVNCPQSFPEFCSEFGYDTDSKKAEATFERGVAFASRLKGFFTSREIEELAEIQ